MRLLDKPASRILLAWLLVLAAAVPSCATRYPESCSRPPRFADPSRYPRIVGPLQKLEARTRQNDVTCSFTSSGFLRVDQVIHISQPENASASAILHVLRSDEAPIRYEAPLDAGLARMLAEVCSEVVRERATCTHLGHDGVWYLLQAQGGAAVTWTPKPETRADTVVDVFSALRAYVTAPEPISGPALQTLRAETYALYHLLGLQHRPRSNTKGD